MIPSIIYNIPYTKPFYTEENLTEDEFYHQLYFQSHNWKHTDGRIHATQTDKDYVALSISPYYKDFRSQIEDKVWPIVSILRDKGYLTISSCEGHGGKSPLYVSLAFGEGENLSYFINYLKKAKIKGLTWELTDTYANNLTDYQSGKFNITKIILEGSDDSFFKRTEIKGLNKMFGRTYTRYQFVHVKLFDHVNIPWWKWVKLLKADRAKKKYLKSSIDQLIQLFRGLQKI